MIEGSHIYRNMFSCVSVSVRPLGFFRAIVCGMFFRIVEGINYVETFSPYFCRFWGKVNGLFLLRF